jgi:hypothetical protein
MRGRWNSNAMTRHLYVQTQPVMGDYVAHMFNQGTYRFLPEETIPIIDVYDEDD